MLHFDAELAAVGLTDPDAVLFRSRRVCFMRLPSTASPVASQPNPAQKASSHPAAASVDASAAPTAAAADAQEGPGAALRGSRSSTGGYGGGGFVGLDRGLGWEGVPLCSLSVAEAALASVAADKERVAGYITQRLTNEVAPDSKLHVGLISGFRGCKPYHEHTLTCRAISTPLH